MWWNQKAIWSSFASLYIFVYIVYCQYPTDAEDIHTTTMIDGGILTYGKWRDLTLQELDGWYSPFDNCMMNTTDFDKSPQHIKREYCSTASVKLASGEVGVCRVGMGSNKKECSSPYAGTYIHRIRT